MSIRPLLEEMELRQWQKTFNPFALNDSDDKAKLVKVKDQAVTMVVPANIEPVTICQRQLKPSRPSATFCL